MTYDQTRYRKLRNGGVAHDAALILATGAASVADVAALTAAAAVGANPTKAEFDKLLADVTAIRTTVNALLASLRAGEVID